MPQVYRKHPLTAGRLVDGLAFVVTAEDQKLHTLNDTASHLWQLCDEGLTVEAAAEALVESFDIERRIALKVARADAQKFLDGLVSRELLRLVDSVYRRHPLATDEVVDGRTNVVTGKDGKTHDLSDDAGHLWQLCDEGLTIEAAAEFLAERIDVELEVALRAARDDARECLEDLVRRDILTIE